MQIPDEIIAAIVIAVSGVIGYLAKYVTGRGEIDLASRREGLEDNRLIREQVRILTEEKEELKKRLADFEARVTREFAEFEEEIRRLNVKNQLLTEQLIECLNKEQ